MLSNTSETTEIIENIDKIITLKNNFTGHKVILYLKLKNNQISASRFGNKLCICSDYESPIESKSWLKGFELLKEMPLIHSLHHQYSLIRGFERLIKNPVKIPARAKYLRTIALELERISSHLYDLNRIFSGIDYPLLLNKSLKLTSEVSNITNNYFRNLNKDFLIVGGVADNLSKNQLETINIKIELIQKHITKFVRRFQKKNFLSGLFRDVGFITRETAKKLGLVGPLARSIGISNDVRRNDPYAAYNEVTFETPVSDYCDILGELIVKCDEILISIKIIKQLINQIPDGLIGITKRKIELTTNSTIVRTESPSGELFYYIHSKEGDINISPRLIRLTTPIKINTQGFLARMTGESYENLKYILLTIGEAWNDNINLQYYLNKTLMKEKKI